MSKQGVSTTEGGSFRLYEVQPTQPGPEPTITVAEGEELTHLKSELEALRGELIVRSNENTTVMRREEEALNALRQK